jgi:lipopolysaccharide export system ATP-binding protein
MQLRAENLIKKYKQRVVVNDVSVEVNQGEIVGLLGPNGAGKTTSFYMIVGLIKADSGQVFLDQTPITKLPMYKRAQMGVGYLPQEASVFRKMSVEDNIAAVLQMTPLSRKEQKAKLESLLGEFGLSGKAWETCCREGNAGARKLPGHWLPIRSLYYSMSLSPVSIPLPWRISRA